MSSHNAPADVCVTPEKGLHENSKTLTFYPVGVVHIKTKLKNKQQKDLTSQQDVFLRRHEAAFVLTVLKYSVLFGQSVYCVSLAKKKNDNNEEKACSTAFELL